MDPTRTPEQQQSSRPRMRLAPEETSTLPPGIPQAHEYAARMPLLDDAWDYQSVAMSAAARARLALLDQQRSHLYYGAAAATNPYALPYGLGSALPSLASQHVLSSLYPTRAELMAAAVSAEPPVLDHHPLLAPRSSQAIRRPVVAADAVVELDTARGASDTSQECPPKRRLAESSNNELQQGGPVKKRMVALHQAAVAYASSDPHHRGSSYNHEHHDVQTNTNSARSRFKKRIMADEANGPSPKREAASPQAEQYETQDQRRTAPPAEEETASDYIGSHQASLPPQEVSSGKEESSKPTSSANEQWNAMFQRLLAYKAVHGDCLVPQRCESDPKLGKWVCYQRKRKANLSMERRRKLEGIGFVFCVRQLEPWDAMFDQLVEYKAKHGDCLVPQNYKESPKLGKWVAIQRIYKDSLTKDRRDRMEDIGFVWSVNEALWNTMFQSLLDYKAKNGHCRVPWNYREDPQLANWVQRQRKNKRRLTKKRLERLKEIGFEL